MSRIKLNNKTGFTLAELLIVVAIIAVLVSISIPIFTSQLEKSREATDLANVRSAYAEMMADAITGDTNSKYYVDYILHSGTKYHTTVPLKQKQEDWQGIKDLTVGGVNISDTKHWIGHPMPNGSCEISLDDNNEVYFNWNGSNLITSIEFKDGSWDGARKANDSKQHIDHRGDIISSWNTASSKFEGLYELKKNTTYKVSYTYNPHLDDKNNPTKGIVAKATLLWDSNGKNKLDSGTGNFKMNEDLTVGKVEYKYTPNPDGTVTYTAIFKTPNESDNYYYGMNFGAMTINEGVVDKSSALKFTSDLGMTSKEVEALKKQIQSNFRIEVLK